MTGSEKALYIKGLELMESKFSQNVASTLNIAMIWQESQANLVDFGSCQT